MLRTLVVQAGPGLPMTRIGYGCGNQIEANDEGDESMLRPARTAHAHCDLMCGVYDPAQARIEAESVLKACEKYQASDDPTFRERCVIIKEERAELVKHHLWVLWTDFFKPHHVEANPGLHELFWRAAKAAGETKKTMDIDAAKQLVGLVDDVAEAFWATEEAKSSGLYPLR